MVRAGQLPAAACGVCNLASALSNLKSGVSILLAVDLRGNRKLEAYATTSATLKFIFDRALVPFTFLPKLPRMLDQRIGFVGAGQMARALARGFVQAKLIRPQQIATYDPVPAAADQFAADVPGSRVLDNNRAVAEVADVVVLAVKPQHMAGVMDDLRGAVTADKLLVSIAAGVPLTSLVDGLGCRRVVRVMPNTPCLIGQGASGYALGAGVSVDDGRLVGQLLGAVGVAFALDERLLDAVTGLSGSGPAYVYTMIEALSDGGVRMGLPRATATALAAHTVCGAAAMVLAGNEHPAVLKDRVASPGGTTIAGLKVLEEHAVRAALIAAVEAATNRSIELGRAAD
jgi:pyrroline-5-carboxylate reductase